MVWLIRLDPKDNHRARAYWANRITNLQLIAILCVGHSCVPCWRDGLLCDLLLMQLFEDIDVVLTPG
jgi:hypothetical protein